jgi:hypothetical protein
MPVSVPCSVFIMRSAVRDVTVPAGRCEANGRRLSSDVIYNIGGWGVPGNDELLIFLVDFHLRRKSLVMFVSPSEIRAHRLGE